ncbi:HD domain-containing protein [Shinella zoogloeoides]|uniref:HD domain-containing protein n=1 Tax=Shinella zoogloeoides TaxID=352475 RepID=UPI00273D378B|nr:HD domain-containing protein [Shinella zoogloeoides]WLR94754.1 HD domain-containing protein [Shinella zoogloeoides]WLR95837.1 HD domain-containing protein [Shinella zoogloeoides]
MNHLAHAIQVAQSAHEGQADKTGRSYFEHCRRVASLVTDETGKIVAYLHDVVEKGKGWTLDRLREEGFPPDVISAVDAMTRREDEGWEAFVRRAASNSVAKPVKLADLEDNLSQVQTIGEDGEKYLRALRLITEL